MEPPRHINSDLSKIYLPAALVVLLTNMAARAGPNSATGLVVGHATDQGSLLGRWPHIQSPVYIQVQVYLSN